MKYTQEKYTTHTVFRLRDDGIIESDLRDGYTGKLELAESVEMEKIMLDYCSDHPLPLLAKLGDAEITDESRKYLIENVHVSAAAFLAKSFIARMMANLMMNFKEPPVPVKLFSTEEKAVAWLRSLSSESSDRA